MNEKPTPTEIVVDHRDIIRAVNRIDGMQLAIEVIRDGAAAKLPGLKLAEQCVLAKMNEERVCLYHRAGKYLAGLGMANTHTPSSFHHREDGALMMGILSYAEIDGGGV